MNINYINGDATAPIGDKHKTIIHCCNNKGGWGKGFVLSLSNKWSLPEKIYRSRLDYVLGEIMIVNVESDITVINMVCQNGFRSKDNPTPLDYAALAICLDNVYKYCKFKNTSVHCPRIGCGLAGGNWEYIEELLKHAFIDNNIPVTVYDYGVPNG